MDSEGRCIANFSDGSVFQLLHACSYLMKRTSGGPADSGGVRFAHVKGHWHSLAGRGEDREVTTRTRKGTARIDWRALLRH